ncbi:MAG: EamA family transporter, partial [Pseudomonadota bacterium]
AKHFLAHGLDILMRTIENRWYVILARHANASYVRALGQIELVFTFIATVFFFKESVSRLEVVGIALVIGGILLILLGSNL